MYCNLVNYEIGSSSDASDDADVVEQNGFKIKEEYYQQIKEALLIPDSTGNAQGKKENINTYVVPLAQNCSSDTTRLPDIPSIVNQSSSLKNIEEYRSLSNVISLSSESDTELSSSEYSSSDETDNASDKESEDSSIHKESRCSSNIKISESSSSSDDSDSGKECSNVVISSKSLETLCNRKQKAVCFDDGGLPPIEDLQITVEEKETQSIGFIFQIVENQVVVQAYPNIPAINIDSVLFLECGKRVLGKVFDVFGSIYEPLYVVRFNTKDDIIKKKIEKMALVYYAPQTDHTSYVIMDELLSEKGSDASWKDNLEPPPHKLDYSDDEEEKKAKQSRKLNKPMQYASSAKFQSGTCEVELKKFCQNQTATYNGRDQHNFGSKRGDNHFRFGSPASFPRQPLYSSYQQSRHPFPNQRFRFHPPLNRSIRSFSQSSPPPNVSFSSPYSLLYPCSRDVPLPISRNSLQEYKPSIMLLNVPPPQISRPTTPSYLSHCTPPSESHQRTSQLDTNSQHLPASQSHSLNFPPPQTYPPNFPPPQTFPPNFPLLPTYPHNFPPLQTSSPKFPPPLQTPPNLPPLQTSTPNFPPPLQTPPNFPPPQTTLSNFQPPQNPQVNFPPPPQTPPLNLPPPQSTSLHSTPPQFIHDIFTPKMQNVNQMPPRSPFHMTSQSPLNFTPFPRPQFPFNFPFMRPPPPPPPSSA